MTDPRETRSKMLALLSLLDVLRGSAKMTGVGVDRVGQTNGAQHGEVRIRFTVFGSEERLMQLATELAELTSEGEIVRRLEADIETGGAVAFAERMIANWQEVLARLQELARPKLESGETWKSAPMCIEAPTTGMHPETIHNFNPDSTVCRCGKKRRHLSLR